MSKIVEKERDLMRHALGLTRGEQVSTRNSFVTDSDGDDGKIWEGLVSRGLATKDNSRSHIFGGMTVYHVTESGRALAAAIAAGA